MTPRRLSKRTLAVNKRKHLETKLLKRKEEADLRLQKGRSKQLQKLIDQEQRLFSEEAFRLCDIADRFQLNQEIAADSLSQDSLEWDNTEEDPSFLTATGRSDPSVDDLIEQILCPEV